MKISRTYCKKLRVEKYEKHTELILRGQNPSSGVLGEECVSMTGEKLFWARGDFTM